MTEMRMRRPETSAATGGDVYLPTEGAPPPVIAAMDATDDRGMEMLARVFVIGAATVVVLTSLYLLWPGLERLVGGLS